jgi:D-beta-D-heptose 7-phosphate kinase/D-beta-D-heptose 1-phosphate adenosyltransferase
MICKSVEHLRSVLDEYHPNQKVWATSGGFDPMHVGHLRCLLETARLASPEDGITVAIVNSDGFLHRKKGYAFMPLEERMEIINGVKGVDYVVPWDDGSQTVVGAIEKLRPNYFTKGGDRDSSGNVPEFDLCEKIGCYVIFGVGGGKIQSSSELVAKVKS